MKHRLPIIVSLILSLGASQVAGAHARLVGATPAVGAAIHPAPRRLELMFSEAISAKLSGATVKGGDGKPLVLATSVEMAGKGLALDLKAPLRPGTYTIAWHAVASDDGHRTSGTYTVTVK